MPTDSIVGPDGRTSCCGAFTTYIEGIECCKVCYAEVIRRNYDEPNYAEAEDE